MQLSFNRMETSAEYGVRRLADGSIIDALSCHKWTRIMHYHMPGEDGYSECPFLDNQRCNVQSIPISFGVNNSIFSEEVYRALETELKEMPLQK